MCMGEACESNAKRVKGLRKTCVRNGLLAHRLLLRWAHRQRRSPGADNGYRTWRGFVRVTSTHTPPHHASLPLASMATSPQASLCGAGGHREFLSREDMNSAGRRGRAFGHECLVRPSACVVPRRGRKEGCGFAAESHPGITACCCHSQVACNTVELESAARRNRHPGRLRHEDSRGRGVEAGVRPEQLSLTREPNA